MLSSFDLGASYDADFMTSVICKLRARDWNKSSPIQVFLCLLPDYLLRKAVLKVVRVQVNVLPETRDLLEQVILFLEGSLLLLKIELLLLYLNLTLLPTWDFRYYEV